MKSIFYCLLFCTSIFIASCKNEVKSAAAPTEAQMATQADTTTAVSATFTCPMHPEIKGKSGDKCSKCAMLLVAEKPTHDEHAGHNH